MNKYILAVIVFALAVAGSVLASGGYIVNTIFPYLTVTSGTATSTFAGPLTIVGPLVGIGTTNPSTNLYVKGDSGITVESASFGVKALIKANSSSGPLGVSQFGTPTTLPMELITNNISRLYVDFGGHIGIGTSTPTTALQVTVSGANATSTLTVGKEGQNKGSCLELFDAVGTAQYVSVIGGVLTVSSTSCK